MSRLWKPPAPHIIPDREIDDRLLCSMFAVNHLNGFNAIGASPGAWQTAWSETLSAETAATGSSLTWVQVVPSSKILVTGGTLIRVRFKAGTGGYAISKAYIGEGASSGDAYDFATTPTQLLFNTGSASFSIGASATITSDDTSFSIPAGKNLCVAWEQTASTYAQAYLTTSGYTAGSNYKSAADAATVDKTGYARYQDVQVINLIEVFA